MEDRFNVGDQDDKRVGQSSSDQPPDSQTFEKNKINHWKILVVVFILIFFSALGFIFLSTRQTTKQNTINQLPTQNPTPTIKKSEVSNIALSFVKDGAIYTADYEGASNQVIDLNKEEVILPKNLYMKLSPDKKYLAYLGTSGGADSAIKIIDINQKTKISQEVYGSDSITDFAWSPDSKRIVVAVNLKNDEKDFTSSLYLIDPFNQTGVNPLFNAENTEITQVEWLDEQSIYYARISYAPEQNTAIVRYDFGSKSRKLKIIESVNEVYNDISMFSIRFLISSDKKDMLAYVFMKDEPMRSKGTSYGLQTLSLPSLDTKPSLLNYVLPRVSVWYKNYIVGIEEIYSSPDSSVVLVSIPQEKERLSLLDMGPSGSFHSVKILEQEGKVILIVWSEFDGKQSISAYDLDKLIEMRRKTYTDRSLWEITDSSSFDL